MKVLAYYPLHYGLEYLAESIKSIDDQVDKIIILYTDTPSYGHAGEMQCPETEQQLRELCEATSDKIEWIPGNYHHEGEHREEIFKHADGYDLILAVDADEVWNKESLKSCLETAMSIESRRFGIVGFVNLWRSFDLACYDGFAPIRIINLNFADGEYHMHGLVYHFSCCQNEEIMRYKWECHGHKSELRDDWWDKYNSGETQDVHPVAVGLWNAVPFDKTTLPEFMRQHPRYNG